MTVSPRRPPACWTSTGRRKPPTTAAHTTPAGSGRVVTEKGGAAVADSTTAGIGLGTAVSVADIGTIAVAELGISDACPAKLQENKPGTNTSHQRFIFPPPRCVQRSRHAGLRAT